MAMRMKERMWRNWLDGHWEQNVKKKQLNITQKKEKRKNWNIAWKERRTNEEYEKIQ